MEFVVEDTPEDISLYVAEYIKDKICSAGDKPFVLGLPTGSTPLLMYKYLVQMYDNNELSFKNVITINLDEYIGLDHDNPQSYHHFMFHNFFSKIDINPENVHIPNTKDIFACSEYQKVLDKHKIDLMILGVGENGHIAFNEPGCVNDTVYITDLSESTIKANSRFFEKESDVPKQAITMSLNDIYKSKEVIVLATTKNKEYAIKNLLLRNEYDINIPCTFLNDHSSLKICCSRNVINISVMNQVNIHETFKDHDRILLLSPHPDDDVICCGGLLQLLPFKDNITVAYMTSGSNAIPCNYTKDCRYQEAYDALNILGIESMLFLNLPFYLRKDKQVNDVDRSVLKTLLKGRYDHVFVCGDKDPNGTHEICKNLILECVSNVSDTCLWFYKGAWNSDLEITNVVTFDKLTLNKKMKAILAHQSQLDPMFTGSDNRPFYKRVNQNFEVFQLLSHV